MDAFWGLRVTKETVGLQDSPLEVICTEPNSWASAVAIHCIQHESATYKDTYSRTAHKIKPKNLKGEARTLLTLQQRIVLTTKMNPLHQNHLTQHTRHHTRYINFFGKQWKPCSKSQSCLQNKKRHFTAHDWDDSNGQDIQGTITSAAISKSM